MMLRFRNHILLGVIISILILTACEDENQNKLVYGAYYGDYYNVREQVMNGTDINAKDKFGNTALMNAAQSNNVKIVKFLLRNGADVNAKNKTGETALKLAVFIPLREKDQKEIVEALLSAKADINAQGLDGMTPLMDALLLQNPDIQMIQTLLKEGADVNIKNKFGKTALDIAKEYGDTNIIKVLTEPKKQG